MATEKDQGQARPLEEAFEVERLPPTEVLPPGRVAARGVHRIEVVGECHVTRPPRDGARKVVEVLKLVAKLWVTNEPFDSLSTKET